MARESAKVNVVCQHCDRVYAFAPEAVTTACRCHHCGCLLFVGRPLSLGVLQLQHHIRQSGIPMLAVFWSPAERACQRVTKELTRLAGSIEPRMRLVEMNLKAAPALATQMGIRVLPTIVLFQHGRELARASGKLTLRALDEWTAGVAA